MDVLSSKRACSAASQAGGGRLGTALLLAATLANPLPLHATTPVGELDLTIEKLRSAKGLLLICLTRDPRHFPDCSSDPAAISTSVSAGRPGKIALTGLAPGRYALSIIHDENGNGKLDTALGIPREGFGFSRNPTIRFGPPRFDEVIFTFAGGKAGQSVRLRYIL